MSCAGWIKSLFETLEAFWLTWGLPFPLHIVSEETRERYTRVIDSILARSDLATISEKRIRKGLQDAVGYDLTPEKVCDAVLCWIGGPVERADVMTGRGQRVDHGSIRYFCGPGWDR